MKKTSVILLISAIIISFSSSCEKDDDITVSTGDTLWIHQIPQGEKEHWIDAKPLAIGYDGTIYYSAGGGSSNWDPESIYAVNKSDGSLKWQTQALATWHINSNVIVGDDGTVYVASYTKLYSINPADGSFNWVWEVPETITVNGNDLYTYGELGPMTLANNGDLIIKTTGDGSYYRALYCIGSGGTMKWYRFIGSENTDIVIGKYGEIIDFEHDDVGQKLTVSNADDGSLMWSIPANVISAADNITIADNGDIITFIHTDSLIRVNPLTHSVLWKTAASTSSDAKTFDSDGNLFLYDQWAGCSVYDISTGTLIKSDVNLPQNPVIDSKNQLMGIISDWHPHMSVTDNSGNIIWESNIDISGNSIAVSDDNIIYFSDSKNVYAVQGDAGLNKNAWPKMSHDNRNTNNYSKF